MLIHFDGLYALQNFRRELQDSAGADYPNGVMPELLVLHDVCKCLELNIFQAKDVLGYVGYEAVKRYIERPCCNAVNAEIINMYLKSVRESL